MQNSLTLSLAGKRPLLNNSEIVPMLSPREARSNSRSCWSWPSSWCLAWMAEPRASVEALTLDKPLAPDVYGWTPATLSSLRKAYSRFRHLPYGKPCRIAFRERGGFTKASVVYCDGPGCGASHGWRDFACPAGSPDRDFAGGVSGMEVGNLPVQKGSI